MARSGGMHIDHDLERSTDGPAEPSRHEKYRPAVDEYAQKLIARIRRNHRDEEAIHALCAHYTVHGDYPSLANLMEGWAETLHRDQAAADALVQAADAVRLSLSDHARARRLYERALVRCPQHAGALKRLETLLHERGDFAGLEHVLEAQLKALEGQGADPSARSDAHFRLGQVYEHQLGDSRKALAHYRRALTLDRTLLPAIEAAREIYERADKPLAVARLHELEVAALQDPGDKCRKLIALSRLRRDGLEDLDGAVSALRRALEFLPGHMPALQELAVTLSQRAATRGGEEARADTWRAAEIYFLIARALPPLHAERYLHSCLRLSPDHTQARRMLSEIETQRGQLAAQGEGDLPLDSELDVELDDRITGNYSPIDGAALDDELDWPEEEVGLEAEMATGSSPPSFPAPGAPTPRPSDTPYEFPPVSRLPRPPKLRP